MKKVMSADVSKKENELPKPEGPLTLATDDAEEPSDLLTATVLNKPLFEWKGSPMNMEHVWFPNEIRKSDICGRCKSKFAKFDKNGLKCSCCHMRVHPDCMPSEQHAASVCRPTFVRVTSDRKPEPTHHHWVAGLFKETCFVCNKSTSSGKISHRCAWCKRTCHKRCSENSQCDMGEFKTLILPPSSIVLKSKDHVSGPIMNGHSHGRMKKTQSSPMLSGMDDDDAVQTKQHTLKRMDSLLMDETINDDLVFEITTPENVFPLLVFINPKSGGNQGAKLIPQFHWALNPRQVVNMMAIDSSGKVVGPRPALQAFGRVEGLRIMVCGGDGTVGWVLEEMDKLGLADLNIPVGTLPLGTGNDLARALKWGGGYDGTSIHKLLQQVSAAVITQMDRWSLDVIPREGITLDDTIDYGCELSSDPPQGVFNNYFSIGSDAYTALKFHLAREANPKNFNGRIVNKMTYGLLGAKDMIRHKFRNLSDHIKLECDGIDKTNFIIRKGLEAVAFLNINSYAAGTKPWGTKSKTDSFKAPEMNDGYIEVIGFESAWNMAKGQIGVGHALRICQCKVATITTQKPLPIQADGEPCMLVPSVIKIGYKNRATMLCRPKGRYKSSPSYNQHYVPPPMNAEEYRLSVGDKSVPNLGATGRSLTPLSVGSDSEDEDEADPLGVANFARPKQSTNSEFPRNSSASYDRFQDPDGEDEKPDVIAVYQAEDEDEDIHMRNIEMFDIYLVQVEAGQSGPIQKLGAVNLDVNQTLLDGRSVLTEKLNLPFRRSAGWRYLMFRKTDEQGSFYVVTRAEEQAILLRLFMSTSGDVKRGLFIALIPDLVVVAPPSSPDTRMSMESGLAPTATPLLQAIMTGDALVVQRLIAQGEPLQPDIETGCSALHVAAGHNRWVILQDLLREHRMDPNAQDFAEQTPLHKAAQAGYVLPCEVLLTWGANPALADKDGNLPMDFAQSAGHMDVYELLTNLEIEVDAEPDMETLV